MTQINVNSPDPGPPNDPDHTGAASFNFLTVVAVLLVVVAVLWFLFTGPFRSGFGGSSTNVNVNPPAQQAPPPNINVNPPSINVNPQTAPTNPSPAPAKP